MKFLKTAGVAVVILLLTLTAIHNFALQPEPFDESSVSAVMLAPGKYQVDSHSEVLTDNYRGTQANGDVMNRDVRQLDTVVWYPSEKGEVAAGQHPLIIYSHGFSSMKEGGAHIGQHLASHGYIVVAANFPLTHLRTAGGPMVEDVVNQPADVSFLIDTMLGWNADAEHPFFGRVDPQRIGATGVSLGGMTTTMAAFHPTMRDPRIKAAASIAGPLSMFGAEFFAHVDLPFMMLATDQDALVYYEDNALPVLERVGGAHLVTVAGGSHTGFSDTAKYLRWLPNPDSVGCRQVLANIDMDAADSWHHLVGTPQQGIIHGAVKPLCTRLPLPEAMNPLRQHMLTKVAIFSFFEMYFAQSDEQRALSARYFSNKMANELPEMRYQRSAF